MRFYSFPILCILLFTTLACHNELEDPLRKKKVDQAFEKIKALASQEKINSSYLEVALAVCRLDDPDLNETYIKKRIKTMAEATRDKIAGSRDPHKKLNALKYVLFKKYNYRSPPFHIDVTKGNLFNYYLINRFIGKRVAVCEGLSALFLFVAEEAQLPVTICNAPVHCYCEYNVGNKKENVECTLAGKILPDKILKTLNGATPAAAHSNVYFKPLTPKEFLASYLNSFVFAEVASPKKHTQLSLIQTLQIADILLRISPDRPESLDTAAYIYHKADNNAKALEIIQRSIAKAKEYGTRPEIMTYLLERRKIYEK